jgi:hypothetical protein
MLARSGRGGVTRFDRARRLAKDLHAEVGGDVPVGLASLTDRVLPHLFPTASSDVFLSTLDRAMGIERPPPDRTGRGRATSLGALAALGGKNFFRPATTKRVAVVFTDGESVPVRVAPLQAGLAEGAVTPVFVRLWSADEQIFDAAGRPLEEYVADPDSVAVLDSVGNALGSRVFGEGDTKAIAAEVRRALGEGPTGPAGRQLRSVELAPYSVAVAFLPLLVLLWRRNL